MSDIDEPSHGGGNEAERAPRRRPVVSRRALVLAGVAVGGLAALGGGALIYRDIRRSAGPEGTWVELNPIVPVPSTSPRATSPAYEPPQGETTVAVWAHADDDIIFANPHLAGVIASGATLRTVFVTAGDAGRGLDYALEREAGIRAAYDRMRDVTMPWETREITLLSGARATRFVPVDDPRLSITVLRLPDGNLNATGFPSTGGAGLTQLINGTVPVLQPVDDGPTLDASRLADTVAELIHAGSPDHVTTNIPHESAFARGDHPDHSCVGSLVRAVAPSVGVPAENVTYYIGYPSQHQPVNVEGDALDGKVGVYETYASKDPVVTCDTASACLAQPGFGQWLRRSYAKTESELQLR
ncbi:LmbE family N-acetylglucosaminyl deacetylase [Microbacterium sp. SORGH_AS 1204]|uniref:PIG-L family deacetylase n=1 Tax=Microbacterium sp. SORGH_AS_1204 TaxID=3041785 RepID=UPI0027914D1F|nr:PIG-L family deacetylase [Microbacterium sp. SORGH_AS_1204]MDQ1137882.1 LmbE family N-acetylglucosaminyl deacetylase [Microbacterium sp. SORGH_AS_1204]